jgi:hypothetical protein
MTKPNEYRAYFTVYGDFDPAEVTALMETLPSESWMKGDRNERTHFERKFSRWSLNSRLQATDKLEDHVEDVLDQLRPIAERVKNVRARFDGHMELVAHFYEPYPGLTFEAKTLLDMGHMQLAMDMDFYYMYSDRREDS